MSSSVTAQDQGLFVVSIEPDQPTSTILLLHGLTSSHREWSQVTLNLPQNYRIILPDLPGHSSSKHITPFSIPSAVSQIVSHLEAQKPPISPQNPCHIIGLSLGGFIALHLAQLHPSLISSVFVTGVGGYSKRRWLMAVAPYFVTSVSSLQRSLLSKSANNYVYHRMGLQVSEELQKDLRDNTDFAMIKQAYRSIAECSEGGPLPIRTLVVAGGKQDDVEGTRKTGAMLRKGCIESRAAVVNGAMHAWNLQFPDLFAKGIKAWVEKEELPAEFKILD